MAAVDLLAQSDIQWGDVPAWVGAGLTGGALLIAALAYRREIADRHAAREAERRAQARLVTVRVDRVRYEQVGANVLSSHPGPHVAYSLRNGSDEPVRDLHVRAVVDPGGPALEILYATTLDPGDHEHIADLAAPPQLRPPRVEATFTDAAGAHWMIDSDGRLQPAESNAGSPDAVTD